MSTERANRDDKLPQNVDKGIAMPAGLATSRRTPRPTIRVHEGKQPRPRLPSKERQSDPNTAGQIGIPLSQTVVAATVSSASIGKPATHTWVSDVHFHWHADC